MCSLRMGGPVKSQVRIGVVIAFLIALATSASAIDVKTDYDHHADFSQFKTYSWAKVEMPNPLWNDRVKDAVDARLSQHGWTKVPDGGDVSLAAIGITKNRRTLRTFYDTWGGGWAWSGFGDAITTEDQYTVGTLILDMFDSRTKKLIWRGSASDVLSEKPEKDEKKLDKAIDRMLGHFPPSSGKP